MKTLAFHCTHELTTSTEFTVQSIRQYPSNIYWKYVEVTEEELSFLKLKYEIVTNRLLSSGDEYMNHVNYFVPDYFIRYSIFQ